ncbi:MAG: hypothetical protein ABEL76_06485 [Bradymonadaceae bacterium]
MTIHSASTRAALLALASSFALVAGCSGGDGAAGTPSVFEFSKYDGGVSDPPPDAAREDGGPEVGHGRRAGASCADSADCRDGLCLKTDRFPGGYCTRLDCARRGCVSSNAVCTRTRGGARACLARCRSHGECRTGYACKSVEGAGSTRVCLPGRRERDVSYGRMKNVVGVDCDPRRGVEGEEAQKFHFRFRVGRGINGFLMVPFTTSGTVRPLTLRTPREKVDLLRGYRHHNSRIQAFNRAAELTGTGTYGKVGFDWPVGVPYAPRFENLLVPGGSYRLTVRASGSTPCLYVLESSAGRTIDLNFYFAGTERVTAENARRDADFQAVLRRVESIYNKAGVTLGKMRYLTLPGDVPTRFKRTESREQAHTLMAYGEPPNRSLEGHLSVDVFLVQDLSVNQGGEGQVLGMSAGIPGAAGFHGNARNGLIFQISDLGRQNDHVAHIMAHELGHFLGLRHTTELVHGTSREDRFDRLLGSTDPIRDTAVCENIREQIRENPLSCDDFDNLMFPVAPPPRFGVDPRLTDGQEGALEASPLTTRKGR